MARLPRVESLAGIVVAIVAAGILIVVLSAVHLLPQLRNPFAETTTVRSEPVILKSITELSRYEAASGSFEVVVDLTRRTSLLPSFLAGSETLFIGQGTDIAFVDFSGLKKQAIKVSADRTSVTVSLPKAQLASSRSTSWPSRRSRPPPSRARCSARRRRTPRGCSTACSPPSASPASPSPSAAPRPAEPAHLR